MTELRSGRTIIIADMHGCYDAFLSLLQKCSLDKEKDKLILLGDAFDRGRKSWELFAEMQKLDKEMGERFIYILGNHDQMLLEAEKSREDARHWMRNGGLETQKSFAVHDTDLNEVRRWLTGRLYRYEDERFICVHAEYDELQPDDQYRLLWERSLYRGYRQYTGKLVIAGHTPLKKVLYIDPSGIGIRLEEKEEETVLPERGHMIIDTGCVFGYRLTAMILRGKKYRLVSAV
ncbi:MAG: metallophosphoesterase [Lachnospiraceae bacterium]|nr:metallophosphoesterase [Lachnospiraceae bacterium]